MRKEEGKIDRAAVLHIPLSQYAFAESEHSLTVRLRARKDNLTECTLYYADRVCEKTPIEFTELPMEVCARDEFFSYFEARVESPYNRICYYFMLKSGQEWTYYYADRFTEDLPDFWLDGRTVDGRSEYYQYPFILRNEILDVPEWFKTAVVYNIFPDSFASSRRALVQSAKEQHLEDGCICRARLGGTLKGITENLDYIQKMGFTCIYLNPIFAAGEYHKYDVLDYYHIDPCMGTEEDFEGLVSELHRRGMKIIIDGVFNHCSWNFFAFEDVVANGRKSRYCNWFYDLEFPVIRPEKEGEKPGYTCFAYERKMPKLNTEEKEVQAYFSNVGAYWVKKYHVDGWRLDVANEISRNFWRQFREAVKRENPEAVLIGEVWEDAQTWLRGDAFDSTMNYEFRRICKEYFASEKPDAVRAAWQFDKMCLRYPANIVRGQLNLLDSHDVPRFLSLCGGDRAKWKQACILLMLMPGVPSLFYGDEQGIMGVSEEEYRSAMIWDGEESFCDFIAALTRIRKEYVDASAEYAPKGDVIEEGMFAFTRRSGEKEITVFVNAGAAKAIPVQEVKKILLAEGYEEHVLDRGGYLIWT